MCFFCLAIPIYALYFFISITANMLDLVEKIKCEIIRQVCFICIDQNNLTDNKKTKKHTKQYYKKVTNLFKRLQVNKQTSRLCEILKYVHIQYADMRRMRQEKRSNIQTELCQKLVEGYQNFLRYSLQSAHHGKKDISKKLLAQNDHNVHYMCIC